MDIPVILISFAFGVAATASCLGICMPFFIPFIIHKDSSAKKGLFTSLIFSVGRLVVYMAVGMLFYFIFSNLLDDYGGSGEVGGLKWLPLALGVMIVIYGIWVLLKLPFPKVCPARYAKGMVTLLLGMLIGSFICPPFIFMLMGNLDQNVLVFMLSIFMFWIGSSLSIVYAGIIAGRFSNWLHKKKNKDKINNICAFIMIFSGFWFMISAFISFIS